VLLNVEQDDLPLNVVVAAVVDFSVILVIKTHAIVVATAAAVVVNKTVVSY